MNTYRILIIGCSGSGKSTLAPVLAKNLDLPYLHLDRIFHGPEVKQKNIQLFEQIQREFIAQNSAFVIEGNYSRYIDDRIASANLIIWLQISKQRSLFRVVKRSLKSWLKIKKRPDMPDAFKERFDREYWDFLKYVWQFEQVVKPRLEAVIQRRNSDCELVIIKNSETKAALIKRLTRN